jgi:hypothetical protein
VYDGFCPTNSKTCSPSPTYHLAGFAAFVITGYNLPSVGKQSSLITGNSYCTGNQFCVYGFFTQALVPGSGTVGGTNFGASIVKMLG